MTKKFIHPPQGPKAVGPYSPAVSANGFVFISGQIPLDPATNELVLDSFAAQARQTLENLKNVTEAAGCQLDDIVKVSIFLDSIDHFSELNAIYEEYFGESKPARSCVEVARLPKGVAVEIEAIAVVR
ncbi:MAG: RidA family protein [bacterium]|jgi:2-iminobutanoate/2-iminopropanoate deaminase|nr:RidA family protein [bacterium]